MKKDVVSTPNSKPVIWPLEFFLNKVNVVVLGLELLDSDVSSFSEGGQGNALEYPRVGIPT